ncbi:MAG: SDR family NAD(P)-dependent oxidoreductase [Rhizorhabdus sp.]
MEDAFAGRRLFIHAYQLLRLAAQVEQKQLDRSVKSHNDAPADEQRLVGHGQEEEDVTQAIRPTGVMCFGRDSTAKAIAHSADLRGQRVVLTGASSGLGLETARCIAIAGADLIVGARDPARATALLTSTIGAQSAPISVLPLDLSDFSSVAAFARMIVGPVDLLIANAGVSKTPDAHLACGLDVRFATNHLGHFLLANLLHPLLAARGARIVVLSSAAHKGRPLDFDNLGRCRCPRDDLAAYGESKTANILFAQEASRRWGDDGILTNAALPGSVLTGLQRHHGDALMQCIGLVAQDGSPNPVLKTVGQGAATTIWAATAPELEGRGGLVLENCGLARPVDASTHPWSGFDPQVAATEAAARLWSLSVALLRERGFAGHKFSGETI